MKPKTFATKNDLPQDARLAAAALLTQHVLDCVDLHSQTKFAHWNLKGLQFISLHELFDKFAGMLDDMIDTAAERVTALGVAVAGTVRQAAAGSRLTEFPTNACEASEVLAALIERYAALASTTRKAIDQATELGDAGTADLLTGQSRELDKALWFLEAHLQK